MKDQKNWPSKTGNPSGLKRDNNVPKLTVSPKPVSPKPASPKPAPNPNWPSKAGKISGPKRGNNPSKK